MITEFQDGFITKTKLNELVGGINENSVGLVDVNGILVNIMILTEDTTNHIFYFREQPKYIIKVYYEK